MAVGALSSLGRSRRAPGVTQLTNRRNRRRLAAALDNVIVVASLPPSQQARAAVVPRRASIQVTAGKIHELAARWLDVEE
jgi:hypothetical protein